MFRSPVSRALRCLVILGSAAVSSFAVAQPLGEPDRGSPGDPMIQEYLQRETAKISARFSEDVRSREAWEASRSRYVDEYFYMLGLAPLPEKTPLQATITGTYAGEGYAVDLLHYQSRPGLYVTGNLYRPTKVAPDAKLPAILYVCGHSGRGRHGNKVAYQSHGIWFARHGYVCLVVDTLQLGEIAAIHHGTYNLQRWWWHSRGYTPAGVEAWNGVRGIDYLVSRPDVDAARIAVTGISGGGAATFWVTCADPRVRVAVPVSGMADLEAYVSNRVINGHCDCMFLYNTFRWPWTRIAALVAPRPMLFTNSDQDGIFPMDANERISNRLERSYSLFGAGDRVDGFVSVGGHAYRQDIRKAAYRFINTYLQSDAREITDSEIDIVSEGRVTGAYPIPPEKLRVFPNDSDLPKDSINAVVDEHFVPLAKVELPTRDAFGGWRSRLLGELRRVTFGYFPQEIPPAVKLGEDGPVERMQSEDGIEFRLRYVADRPRNDPTKDRPTSVLLVVDSENEQEDAKILRPTSDGMRLVHCEPRGIGATRWTSKNPPNYVERSHALLGRTVDTGRVWDVIAASRYLRRRFAGSDGTPARIVVAGTGGSGVIGAYAALLDESIGEVRLVSPPASHQVAPAPRFLNVLRVCDLPDVLGLLAPRPLTIDGVDPQLFPNTVRLYEIAGAQGVLTLRSEK